MRMAGHYIHGVDAGYFITGQEYTIVLTIDNITVDSVITGKQYKIVTILAQQTSNGSPRQ